MSNRNFRITVILIVLALFACVIVSCFGIIQMGSYAISHPFQAIAASIAAFAAYFVGIPLIGLGFATIFSIAIVGAIFYFRSRNK